MYSRWHFQGLQPGLQPTANIISSWQCRKALLSEQQSLLLLFRTIVCLRMDWLVIMSVLRVMTSPKRVGVSCEKWLASCRHYWTAVLWRVFFFFLQNQAASICKQRWHASCCVVSELMYLWHRVSFEQQWMWEGSCTCPFVLVPEGGSLCLSQSSVDHSDKFPSINHAVTDSNWGVYSRLHIKWAAGWAVRKNNCPLLLYLCLCFLTYKHTLYTYTCAVLAHTNRKG